MTDYEANRLFTPSAGGDLRDDLHCAYRDVKAWLAVAVLHDFADTGDISWNNFCEYACYMPDC